jgi:hypothetical protein
MKICDTLDVRGSYSEIVAVDYDRGNIGPFHTAMASTHHAAIGVGHNTTRFQKAAQVVGNDHSRVPTQQEVEMQRCESH